MIAHLDCSHAACCPRTHIHGHECTPGTLFPPPLSSACSQGSLDRHCLCPHLREHAHHPLLNQLRPGLLTACRLGHQQLNQPAVAVQSPQTHLQALHSPGGLRSHMLAMHLLSTCYNQSTRHTLQPAHPLVC